MAHLKFLRENNVKTLGLVRPLIHVKYSRAVWLLIEQLDNPTDYGAVWSMAACAAFACN
jgi:hypothetical protein